MQDQPSGACDLQHLAAEALTDSCRCCCLAGAAFQPGGGAAGTGGQSPGGPEGKRPELSGVGAAGEGAAEGGCDPGATEPPPGDLLQAPFLPGLDLGAPCVLYCYMLTCMEMEPGVTHGKARGSDSYLWQICASHLSLV